MRRLVPVTVAAALLALGCDQADYFKMEPTSITLEHKGKGGRLKAIAMNRQGAEFPKVKPGKWVSEDEKVVKVDGEGSLEALASGSTKVKAIHGDIVGEVLVDVVLVEKFEVEPKEVKLVVDGDPFAPTIRVLDARGKPLAKRLVTAKCKDEKVCHTDGGNQLWPGAAPGETEAEFRCEGNSAKVKVVVTK